MLFLGFIASIILICGVEFAKWYLKDDPEKILGIYSQKGKWFFFKYYFLITILSIQRIKYYVLGIDFWVKPKKLEKLQTLSDHPKAFDAVFFQGVSQEGIYFCGGTERRHGAIIHGFFYLLIPGYGLLMSKKLPKTTLNASPETIWNLKQYSAEGITFAPIEPMKLWKIAFKGEMRSQYDAEKVFDVNLNGNWTTDIPWFFFEVDMPCSAIARAISREPWNKDLFRSLKQSHQSHYEQMGYFEGTVVINSKTIPLKLDSFRDHSFGQKRDWSLMHRYVFHMFYLASGVKICLGVVCQPCTTSHLEMGYIVNKNKQVQTIEKCDLSLYQHGENGLPPENISFTFVANNVPYAARVQYDYSAIHYIGNDKDAKMHERFFTCEVNDVKGRGISEWHYNNSK